MINLARSFHQNNKLIFFVVSLVVVVLLIDTTIAQVYRLIYGNVYSTDNFESAIALNVMVFALLASISVGGQYVILDFVKKKSGTQRDSKNFHLRLISGAITVLQFGLVVLILLLILQMVLTSSYSVWILISIIVTNYVMGGIIMGLLALRFFSWFRTDRTAIILFYGLAAGMLTVNLCFTFAHASDLLANQPLLLRPHILHVSASPAANPIIANGFLISSIASFILSWSATVLLLRHYSKRVGKLAYWIVMAIPLAYFLVQFQPLFLDIFHQYRMADPVTFGVIYTLVFALSKPIGGVIFGAAMWTVAKNLSAGTVRDYLIISAYGLVLFFVSNQAIVSVQFGYPPYGIVAASFLGLSSYLILIGIYSAAVSVAQDIKLRGSIRKLALEETKFLDLIGTAQMERQIIGRVLSLSRQNIDKMKERTGLESSLEDEDMAQYIRDVLKEVKGNRQVS
jgi:hypothetical protein